MSATTLTRPGATTARPRPHFAREIEDVALRLPPGKKLGTVFEAIRAPSGDLLVLQRLSPPNPEAALPHVLRFSPDGELAEAWGGPDHLPRIEGVAQWPTGPEGLTLDADGNYWIFGFAEGDTAVMKFTPRGELLLRIGDYGRAAGNDDTFGFNRPTSGFVDPVAREVFISDGYGNSRVIAFDADTGAFTRMWGAYGKPPSQVPPEEAWASPVHKVAEGPGGRVYVADRVGCRVQEFERVPGGARFTREVRIAPGTPFFGSAFDIGFSPDGAFMYVADGMNERIWIIELASFEVLGSTTAHHEYENAGNMPAYTRLLHRFSVEPNGDLLLACSNAGLKRLRFLGVS